MFIPIFKVLFLCSSFLFAWLTFSAFLSILSIKLQSYGFLVSIFPQACHGNEPLRSRPLNNLWHAAAAWSQERFECLNKPVKAVFSGTGTQMEFPILMNSENRFTLPHYVYRFTANRSRSMHRFYQDWFPDCLCEIYTESIRSTLYREGTNPFYGEIIKTTSIPIKPWLVRFHQHSRIDGSSISRA